MVLINMPVCDPGWSLVPLASPNAYLPAQLSSVRAFQLKAVDSIICCCAGFSQWHSDHHTKAPAADTVKPAGQGWLAGLPHSSLWVQSRRLGCYACRSALQVEHAQCCSINDIVQCMCYVHAHNQEHCLLLLERKYCVGVSHALYTCPSCTCVCASMVMHMRRPIQMLWTQGVVSTVVFPMLGQGWTYCSVNPGHSFSHQMICDARHMSQFCNLTATAAAYVHQIHRPIVLAETVYICRGDSTLGSCVAVSAALLPQQLAELKKQQQQQQQPALGSTPLLITHGSLDSELPRARVEATVAGAKALGIHCTSANADYQRKLGSTP